MNKTKLFLFVIISFFSQSFSAEKYVIGARRGAGFFSGFFHVLMHVIGCKKNDLIPVVYWDDYSPYYVANDNQYNNVWEYYFEPISNLRYKKGDEIHRNFKCEYKNVPYIHARMPGYRANFDYNFRKYINDIMQEYIKIKKPVLEKVELFFNKYMKKRKIIGVHVRQSIDKLLDRVPLLDVDVFLKIASKYEGYKIFVASDNYSVIEKFKIKFPGRVIFYNSHRSSDSLPHFLGRDKKDPLNVVIGEEVLIEAILLSRCDLFVHSVSNVATAVLFFNPELKHIFVDSAQHGPKFGKGETYLQQELIQEE